MQNAIKTVLNGQNIFEFGFAPFDKNDLLNCRAAARLPQNAKSMIVCLFPYAAEKNNPKNISRYAAVADYHIYATKVLEQAAKQLKQQFKDCAFESFCDNSPIKEVKAAAAAGLGVVGQNGLLINETYGSYVFIGEIVTDINLPVTKIIKDCTNCGACLNSCPTGYLKNREKTECLSAITQQKKPLTDLQKNCLLQNRTVWGCDICQQVCPLNGKIKLTNLPYFLNSYRNEYKIGEDGRDRAYNWRGEQVILRNASLLEKQNKNK